MNIWMNGKSLMKHHYLKKEEFYSNVNMEYIKDADYLHAKGFCKDLYSNIFRNLSTRSYKFLSSPGLDWPAALKKTKVKLELLTDSDMLLMVERGIRQGICHSIILIYMQKLIINI